MASKVFRPLVPYSGGIPGGLHEGKLIEIQGSIPYGAQRFEVNLCCGADPHQCDRALHLSVRFDGRAVVRNAKERGQWGGEERTGHFPFSAGSSFTIMIMVGLDCYRIAVNGSHCYEFRHRLAITRVTALFVDGSVQIERIEFFDQNPPYRPGPAVYPSGGITSGIAPSLPTCPTPNYGGITSGIPSTFPTYPTPNYGRVTSGIVPNFPTPNYGGITAGISPNLPTCPTTNYGGITAGISPNLPTCPTTNYGGITAGISPNLPTCPTPNYGRVTSGIPSSRPTCPVGPSVGTCIIPPPSTPATTYGGYTSDLAPVYNPTIPYAYPIYGGLKPGMMIYVSGRPSASAYRFVLNFQCGTSPYPPPDITFHLDVRFFNRTVVRNSRSSDQWEREETLLPNFPFQPGQNFDLILRCEQDRWMVALNGQHLFEFRHRLMPLSRFDTLYIENDIIVSSIRFA